MAITISDTEPRVQYTATSSQTTFSVPFEFFTVNDIKVYNGSSLLSYNASPSSASQYSVTGAGVTGGGQIVLGGGATLNDIITIYRDLAISRSTDFPTSGAFQIDSLNTELDKIIAMSQQLERDLKFSPKAAATTSNTFNLTFPNLVADKILSVNAAGTALEFSQSITNVNTIAAIASDVTTVSGIAANVTSVAGNAANINLVAGSIGSVNTVAADIAKVIAVANDLAEAVSEVETVADDLNEATSEIDTVATNIANVNTVGTGIANVNTVAGISSDITTVAGISSNVTTVANNVTGVNSFADRYRVGSSDPSTSLDAGDLNFNTNSNDLKYYNGSSWNVVANQDINVKVSANDTSSGVLSSKITATGSTGVSLTETNDGSNETLNVTLASVPNASLSNSAITINGSAVSLGGSVTVGETKPTVTSSTPSTISNAVTNIVIAGTNFVSIPQVEALNPSTGIWYVANSVTYTSATSITANFTLAVDANYKIRVENPDGNSGISSTNILTVSDAPTFTTASGTLGTIAGDFSGAVATVAATSDSAVTYSETTSVLTNSGQANCALNSSTGAITTTDFGGSSTTATLYNFTIRATDAESQTVDRAFSLTSSFGATGGGQFN